MGVQRKHVERKHVERKNLEGNSVEVSLVASLARHLAFAPVAFAVTEGRGHVVRYANMAFQSLQATGEISIGQAPPHPERPGTDLTPLLDRAFRGAETIRDELLAPPEGTARWNCTVWPIATNAAMPEGLVLEVRDAAYVEGAMARQRAIAERLLLGALREHDTAEEAVEATRRADFLAAASRDLSRSLDQDSTRALVRQSALPRKGTWCIVDIIESNGAIHRLAVIHPDPAKQELAQALADRWYPKPDDPNDVLSLTRLAGGEPLVITPDSEAALVAAVHGPENLAILRQLGFGALLVVPLIVRDTVIGTITFVTPEGGDPFSPEEISLASDLANRCAMALDNARLYREADALRASASEANRTKSEFLGSMSHELRTPLNAIGGYVELLQMASHGPLNPEQRADLGRIKHNQEHLVALIAQILTFVRTESGRMEYQFTDVPVDGAMKHAADLLDGIARERRIALEVRPGASDVTVRADPDRVRQILVNLVMNAVKYGSVGKGRITLSADATADSVSIHVADTGAGIPAEKLEAIFEPFVQLADGVTSRQGGVGLGLAISRDLARAMKGNITVESTVGVGSRFTLTLPRARHG
jgi:signal transduction histidine kinase